MIPVVKAVRVIHTIGELARDCWGGRAKQLLGWIPEPQAAGAGSAVVDSLASWLLNGIDSTNADVTDAFIATGLCRLRIEADSSWTVRDWFGLVFATVESIDSLAVIGLSTEYVHRIGGTEEANPNSAVRFVLGSETVQPVEVAVWHSDQSGLRTLLRYAAFDATASTVARLALQSDQIEFPLFIDFDGDENVDQIVYPDGSPVAVPTGAATPSLALGSANPFRHEVVLRYVVPSAGFVSLDFYDVSGRLIANLISQRIATPGTHTASWDGRDASGHAVASGVYFCHLSVPGGHATERLVLIR